MLRWLVFCRIFLLPFASSSAQTLTPHQQIAFDIYKELVEINTVTATGDTERAAEAMAARLRAAGFAGSDVQVFSPAPRKGGSNPAETEQVPPKPDGFAQRRIRQARSVSMPR